MDINCYKALFEQSSAMLLLVDKDFTVMAASDSYLKVTKTIREEITGKNIFDVFPDNPNDITADGARKMRASFNRVIKNKKAGTPAFLKYNIPKPQSEGGGFEVKYWRTVVSPMFDANNKLRYIIQRSEDVTENEALTAQLGEEKKALKIIEQSNKRYHTILMQSPFAFSIMKGKDMLITHANNLMKEFWGKGDDVEGKTLLQLLPELIDQPFPAMMDTVYTTGKPVYANEILARLNHNGKIEERYFNVVYQPHLEADETISGVIIIAHEVTNQVIVRNKIKESEHRYHELVNSSPSLISICKGENMIIEIANNAMLESWGKGNIIGKSLFDAIPESVEQGFDKLLLGVYKTGVPVQAYESPVTLLRNGTKELVYYNFIYQAQRNVNGEIEGVAIIATEVTSQALLNKKVKASEEQFRLLVQQAPVAICVLRGKDYLIETINEGMFEMWDRTLEQTINKPAFDVLPELKEQGFKELLDNVYNTGKRFVAEELPIQLKRSGKLENIFIKFIYEPLREADGTISGVMALAHEITEQVVARKKVEESETKFRTLIEDAPVATCFFTGREMTIAVANNTMLGVWGKDKNVIGKTLADAVPELKGQPFLQILDEVFTTGKIYEAKNALAQLEVNGVMGTYYFDYTYKPIHNAAGEVYGIMDMAVDVTEQVLARKKIEESESHFRHMADLMPSKISNAGIDGKVFYFNKNWLDFLGLDFEEVKDFGYYKIMHPDELEEFQKRFLHATETGDDLEMEMRFKNKEGKFKWHLNIASPVKDENGNIKMWVGSTTEIQKIKEEEQRKGDFIKMVSHELKTPVTSIKGYVQLLLMMLEDVHEKPDPLQLKTSLVRIDRQVAKLTRLIIEMLDLTRIEESKLAMQKKLFNLNDMVTETVVDFSQGNLKHTINVYHDYVCNITGDKDRIEQVLINFIANAIKYSPNNGNIEVRVKASKNNQVAVSVKDNGIGIDAKDHQKIFERFYRVSGKSEQYYSGFGIGLFIANAIIESQDGFITIDSEKGKGSVFTFTLPCT